MNRIKVKNSRVGENTMIGCIPLSPLAGERKDVMQQARVVRRIFN